MTIEEAKKVRMLLDEIEALEKNDNKIRKLHKDEKWSELANLAFSMNRRIIENLKQELFKLPPLKTNIKNNT